MVLPTGVPWKGGSVMEPQKIDKPVQSRGEGSTAPPRQPERKRRFQLIKLEERIAPGGGGNTNCHHCYGSNQTTRF
jgi:hypothetical protein